MTVVFDKVIVVDESDANILFWDMLLPELGLTVFKTRAGAEALEMIEKENIHLAIVSWELSSMPGLVLIQKARESRKRKQMPFLIYSKRMSSEDAQILKEMSVDNIVSLPFERGKIREIIEKIKAAEVNVSPLELKLRKMEEILAEGKPAEVLKMVGPDVSKKGPHQPRYKVIIAETFLQIGNIDKAMKAVTEAIEIDPNYLPAIYLKARLYTASGKHDEAIEMMQNVVSRSPKNIESMVNLGTAYVSADKLEEGKKTLAQIQALDPDSKPAKETEGKIALKEGNIDLAAQLLSETQNGDEVARFYNSIGISMVAKGQFEKGIETYLSAIKILSTKAKLHLLYFNLALAYRKKGDKANEVNYFCESYSAEPAFEKAYACIARGVQEAKTKGVTIDSVTIQNAASKRKTFLETHPEIAKKIKARLEKQAATSKN